jgi:hypothetical protein
MRTPIVIKNGTAIRLKELIPLTICWAIIARGRSKYKRVKKDEMATA